MTCQPIQPWVRPIEERINAAIAALEAVELAGEKITTPLDFGSVVWRAWGERGKPELVLLHGGSGSWGHWIANVLPLAESNRVLVPDIPGFGDSAVPPAPHAADDVARALRAGLDMVLDQDCYHLAGFSFGAMISGHLAALDSRVATLALVGAVGLGIGRRSRPVLHRVPRDWPTAERWALQAQNLSMQMLYDPKRIDDLAIHLQDTNVRRARLKSSMLSSRETLSDALASLPIPVAAVWGEKDSIYAGHDLVERQARICQLPQGEMADLIPEGGHWIAYECPAAFNGWLLAWLDRNSLG